MPYIFALIIFTQEVKLKVFTKFFRYKLKTISGFATTFLGIFGLFISTNSHATNPFLEKIWFPQFKTYTVDDGLSQSATSILLQDSDELIWLLTPTGVDRFNGYEFESIPFQTVSFQSELMKNPKLEITALFLNHQQNVMAVSNRGDIFIFDKELNYFALLHSPVNHLNVTHAQMLDDGKLFLFTKTGLHLFNLVNLNGHASKSDAFQLDEVPLEMPQLANITNTHDVVKDKQGFLWFTTRDGLLYFFDFQAGQLITHTFDGAEQGSTNNKLVVTALDEGGVIVAFSSGEIYQIPRQSRSSISSSSISGSPILIGKLKGIDKQPDNITDIVQDPNGYIWITTRGNGLYRLSLKDLSAQQYKNQNNIKGSISSNNLYSLFITKQGFLWVGAPNGINFAQVNDNRFFQIGGNYAYSIPLASPFVSSIYLDPLSQLWVGSHDAGFCLLIPSNNSKDLSNSVSSVIGNNNFNYLAYPEPVFVKEFASGPNNLTWVTSQKKLSWFNAISGQNIPLAKEWQSISQQGVEAIAISHRGKLLVSQTGHLTFEDQAGNFFHLNLPKVSQNDNDSYAITGPVNKKYWIASGDQDDVFEFNSQTKEISKLNIVTRQGNKISSVLSLWMSPTNELWIATYGDGIVRKNLTTGILSWLDTDSGLANNYIYGLLADAKGYLWITSNKGLTRLDLKSEKLQNFSVKDGLQSNEFNAKAVHRSKDGLLFFGGINGITVIDENTFELNQHLPKTYIQDASLLTNKGLKRLEIRQQKIQALDYHSNSLTFKIGAIDLQNQQSINYSYRLLGQNSNWTELANHREITLLELPAGTYSLQVKSCNSEGTCNPDPVEVSFYIPPPPWLSWWAYIVYSISLLLAFFYFIKHHQNQLIYEKQQANKEKQIADDLRDLHELKDQFLTNTSHELRTPLNGIIGLSEMIELDPDNGYSEDSIESIKAINNCGHQLSSLVEDLLDFAQLQNKRLILKMEYFDINELVKHIALLLQPQANKRQLKLKAIYLNVPTNVLADINRIRQVIYNLVNNAIKFSNSGSINIILLKTGHLVKLTVKDQGIGIDKHLHHKVFESFAQVDGSNSRMNGGIGLGLAISKDIIELHGGELKVISELGKGTEFSFKLRTSETSIDN